MPHVTDPGTPAPPVAPRFLPGGAQAVLPADPYAGMRDRDLPAMRDYLAAERAHYDQQLDAGVHEELAAELIAYSVDFDGGEVYQLRVRDLVSGTDLADRIDGTYYELAWAADSRSFFYTVPDALYRPHEIWRHTLGPPAGQDVLVFGERDKRFDLTVRSTRSGAYVLIESASRDTTETLIIPAADA